MRPVALTLCLALAGCATDSTILIVSHADRQIARGTVDWLAQHAMVTLNGHNYQGDYILSPSLLPQTTVIINNGDNSKKGGTRQTSTPRSKNGSGKMLLLSNDGDTLNCEFSYEETVGIKAIGACTDSAKRTYDLQINTAF